MYQRAAWAFDSIYFGGGTPSILPVDEIHRILEAVGAAFDILTPAEITLEVNPGTVDEDRLRAYRKLGVNRLNIGVQSFQEELLQFLGRCHTAAEARRVIEDARAAGFNNIGLDLIYGLPGQQSIAWQADLEAALAYAPEHLSCYMLTYEANTPLGRACSAGDVRPQKDKQSAALFRQTVDYLASRGYRQYEVSNFAAEENYQSRHNRKYWNRAPYLGLGPSAHSFHDAVRRWNVQAVTDYIDRLAKGKHPTAESERLTRGQQLTEAIYLGLRTVEGLKLDTFKRQFGYDFRMRFQETIFSLQEKGLAKLTPDRFRLTHEGLLFLDSIVVAFDEPEEADDFSV